MRQDTFKEANSGTKIRQNDLSGRNREKRDQVQQHQSVYQNLRKQLEDAAKTAGKAEYERVMKDYAEYTDLNSNDEV